MTTLIKRMNRQMSDIPRTSVPLNMLLIASGCLIYTLGMKSVLIPNQWFAGGITGLAMILHYWFEALDVGWMYFFLNIPLLLLGWFHISRRFMWYTIFGMLFFSYTASRIQLPPADIHEPMLAVIFSGVICGVGGGLILRSIGSAGGLDILGIYLNKRFGVRPGVVILFANSIPLALGSYLFGLEKVLYSIAFLFVYTKTMDTVITGWNQRKSVFIVSDLSHEIATHILSEEHRGITILKGEGAYSEKEQEVLFTITSLTDLPKMKELIFSIDPNAFVVVNNTSEVLGRRHGKLKVY
ncbi:hypothetical protein U27_05176 [Candidatus Vecturithrix granuli]|uniref:DUF2179 domain-containing protein n=1 Tax=Vecturithrix granuli TaxID=1499967 RepID=A0A081C0U8_VECG1|nr:hypothetical protein U27_05176 [Candidatus Vecturithrix granuli]